MTAIPARIAGRPERTVADLMHGPVIAFEESATLGDAADLLAGYEIEAVAVVDGDGRLVGVISQTDLVRVRGAGTDRWVWHGLLVTDFMSAPALCVRPAASISEAAGLLTGQHVHQLFVVDGDGLPTGVIGQHDIVLDISETD